MKRLVARTILGVPGVEGRQVQAVSCVVNEVGQVAFGQAVLKSAGQQLLLFGVVSDIAGSHAFYFTSHF